jgi:hypothetical protein
MSDDLDWILKALPRLTPADRSVLAGRLALLVSPGRPVHDGVSETCSMLGSLIGKSWSPVAVLRKSRNFQKLSSGIVELNKFLNEVFPGVGHSDRRKVTIKVIQCVLDGLHRRRMPAAPWAVGWGLSRVGQMVEESYPGYLEAGLMGPALLNSGGALCDASTRNGPGRNAAVSRTRRRTTATA